MRQAAGVSMIARLRDEPARTRLEKMVHLLTVHADVIEQYPVGSLELNFHRDPQGHDSVRLRLKEVNLG